MLASKFANEFINYSNIITPSNWNNRTCQAPKCIHGRTLKLPQTQVTCHRDPGRHKNAHNNAVPGQSIHSTKSECAVCADPHKLLSRVNKQPSFNKFRIIDSCERSWETLVEKMTRCRLNFVLLFSSFLIGSTFATECELLAPLGSKQGENEIGLIFLPSESLTGTEYR